MQAMLARFTAAARGIIAIARSTYTLVGTIIAAALTPLLEKNPTKLSSWHLPFVFSMARLIVLAFAIGMLRQMWKAGIVAWPEATLALAIVLALPLVAALERAAPGDVLAITQTLINRFGQGAARDLATAYATEPSKYDDHRRDTE